MFNVKIIHILRSVSYMRCDLTDKLLSDGFNAGMGHDSRCMFSPFSVRVSLLFSSVRF